MIGAVDIGGTKIAVGAVSADGRVVAHAECPTDPQLGPEHALRRIATLLIECRRRCGSEFEGIGIGCTGPVDPANGVIGDVALLPGWRGFALVRRLSEELGAGAAMENDADAAALGEWTWGLYPRAESFLFVSIGTGIGCGFVSGGRLYRGVDGSHPEIGHHSIDLAGLPCYCGARGCWESLASGPALADRFWKSANATGPSPGDVTAREVCDRALRGDVNALRAVAEHAALIGIGLANLVTIFCPSRVVLGGGLFTSGGLFLPAIKEAVRLRCGLVPHEKTAISLASLGPDAGLLGAAQVWLHRQPISTEEIACS